MFDLIWKELKHLKTVLGRYLILVYGRGAPDSTVRRVLLVGSAGHENFYINIYEKKKKKNDAID